jgi:FkbM family methyltransferase
MNLLARSSTPEAKARLAVIMCTPMSRYHGRIRFTEAVRMAMHATFRRFGVDINRIPSDRWLREMPVRTVLDIGANTGQFARAARHLFPTSQIYSFEPLEDCFRQLRLSFDNDPLWRGYQCALGSEEGEAVFHRSTSSASSSMLTMAELHTEAFPETSGGWDERVQIHRLDDILSGEELAAGVLLKLDVQGFEDRVLDGATWVLTKSQIVITEVSFDRLYHDQALFEDIYGRLRQAGFAFHGTSGQLSHPADGRILQADAIFLRDQDFSHGDAMSKMG